MGIREIIGDKRDAILALAAKHGAANVRIFGSVAEGKADEASDVDFLLDMKPGRSLFDLGGLLMDLPYNTPSRRQGHPCYLWLGNSLIDR
jgi:predicted nucleotidyltransferase